MTSTKLSEAEKQEIIRLYQDVPEETTITLAERYGVSSSTVRRVLQNAVPKDVYDILTAQKQRLHRTGKRSSTEDIEEMEDAEESRNLQESLQEVQPQEPEPLTIREKPTLLPSRRRRRSSVPDLMTSDLDEVPMAPESAPENSPQPNYSPQTPQLEQLFADDRLEPGRTAFSEYDEDDEEAEDDEQDDEDGDEEDTEDDDQDDYLGAFGDEEDSEDDDDEDENQSLFSHPLMASGTTLVKILPLTETALPKTCYLVIDRSSELIAKPLRAFSELGRIPEEEIQEKTLPVFDNHRVASRFSGRNQRVFKVPDGRLLRKAASHLQAKGITRLLIDGQVYRF